MRYAGDDYATPPDGFYDQSLWDTLIRLWYGGGILWFIGVGFCVLMVVAGLIIGSRRGAGVPATLFRNVDALGAVIAHAVRGSETDVREKAQKTLDANQEVFGDLSELMNLISSHHSALTKANTAVKEVEEDKAKPRADEASRGLTGMSGGTVINIAVNNGQAVAGEGGATPPHDGDHRVPGASVPGAIAAVGSEIVTAPRADDKRPDARKTPGFDTTTKVWLVLQKLAAPWRDRVLMREHYASAYRQMTSAQWRDPLSSYGAPEGSAPGTEAARPRWRR